MLQACLPLTPDDQVHLCTARLDEMKEEFAFAEKQTILAFGVDLAMRFGASTEVHDELIGLALKHVPVSGLHYALQLASRAGTKTKARLLGIMLSPFQCHDVDRVINYARDVLLRALSLEEVRIMTKWFMSCSNDSEKEGRQRLREYIQEVHPQFFKEFEEYFAQEQAFWEGPGSLI